MVRRTRVAVGLIVALTTVLTACGARQESTGDSQATQPPVTTPLSLPPADPTTTTATSESAPRSAGTKCTAKDLKGTVAQSDAAAGNRYAELVVTNTSDRTCTLYGYGGLQLVDANHKPTPTDLAREPDPAPSLVTLPPGGTAAKKLHWGVVPSGNEPATGTCEPASAGARATPPDDTRSFIVTYQFGSVCARGHMDGSAYFKE